MLSISRCIYRLMIVCFCAVLFAGCSDNEQKEVAAPSVNKQTDVQKYNAYVAASNQYGWGLQFDSTLAEKHDFLTKIVDGTHDFQRPRFSWKASTDKQLRTNLEKALALPGRQPALDAAAQALLDALKQVEPLSSELAYYSETSGHLSDGGAKAQSIAPQLLPLMEDAANAMDVFEHALEQADDALMRITMEQTKEGTLDRYRITSVYYAKRIYGAFHEAHDEITEQRAVPPSQQLLEDIQQDLQAFDRNTQAYLAYTVDHKLERQCSSHVSHATDFLSESRQLLPYFQQYDWSYWERQTGTGRSAHDWNFSFKHRFERIINDYNSGTPGC